ncbi:adenylate/guanylate cyclase domain-containing protein [Hoeflea sp. WL0058]|uniref:Adenylate/guanylate cyclase domain-containing protein n=1 Tax=Flavimaribacter sediminis TaxID=2865987 RepID=A0AAE2ZPS3_9HYPH|nr:adenylate/guanylate cyclase domain-containing protein [Flavimaribacter sediminis]MBW8640001.1 adenylate/guanylate cyclase domain-containing protein [Flavimaribacter sediminis]
MPDPASADADAKVVRKLTTIMAADAAGYSTAMDNDEVGTLASLRAARKVFSRFIERHNGRIANTAGDGMIADFPSVVEAVQCAIEVQQELNGSKGPEGGLHFRIGIHLGDVIVDGEDLLGEGVNLAARLQTMAEPGGILISQQVYDQVHTKLSVGFDYLGVKHPKNLTESVTVYGVSLNRAKPAAAVFGRHANRQAGAREASRESAERSRRSHCKTAHREDSDASRQDDDTYRTKVIRHAQTLGLVLVGLAVIDFATGSGMWVQWPAIPILAVIGIEMAPLAASRSQTVFALRMGVAIAALALINLFSWSGTLWFLWPAGAMILAALIRKVAVRT